MGPLAIALQYSFSLHNTMARGPTGQWHYVSHWSVGHRTHGRLVTGLSQKAKYFLSIPCMLSIDQIRYKVVKVDVQIMVNGEM